LSLVVDASVAIAWLLPDESSDLAELAITRIWQDGGVAPASFRAEVANTLEMAVRRRRIPDSFRTAALLDLTALPVSMDSDGVGSRLMAVSDLAANTGLTVYDALYLELAHRLDYPLATLDAPLRSAAQAMGVTIFPS
jgi:predicted nucleic acid-binding protein